MPRGGTEKGDVVDETTGRSTIRTRTALRRSPLVVMLLLAVLAVPGLGSAAPGDLDPSFGSGGKVESASLGGVVNDAVVQSDGKILVVGGTLARLNADGSPDTSFGVGGLADGGTGTASGNAIGLQADGKIVIVGYPNTPPYDGFRVARYTPSGALDPTFGVGGTTTTDMGTLAFPTDLAISNGKIVVVGITDQTETSNRIAVARYTSKGALDPTFGNGGKVFTRFPGTSIASAEAVTILSSGKILVVGAAGPISSSDFALVRYYSNGALDNTFGSGGRVRTNLGMGDFGEAIAVQPNGKIVVGGYTTDNQLDTRFALARYTSNGALDPGYGTGGIVRTSFSDGAAANEVVIQSDAKIVAIGSRFHGENPGVFALARYTTAGVLDTTFGGDGRVTTTFTNDAFAVGGVVQPDGKILAVGTNGYTADGGDSHYTASLARYTA